MPATAFREQMRALAARFEVLPVGEALASARGEAKRERPLVSVTFDDGYADQHDVVAPILDEFGLRATFYVTTGFVAARGLLWFDRAAAAFAAADSQGRARAIEAARVDLGDPTSVGTDVDEVGWVECLKRAPASVRERLVDLLGVSGGPAIDGEAFAPMSVADVADLARRGHEVGSHSVGHEILPALGEAELASTLERSRADLERWTGASVRGFCFPNGDHDARTVEAVRAAGYAHACTTVPARNRPGCDPLRIARFDVTPQRVCTESGQHDPAAFRAEVCALHAALL